MYGIVVVVCGRVCPGVRLYDRVDVVVVVDREVLDGELCCVVIDFPVFLLLVVDCVFESEGASSAFECGGCGRWLCNVSRSGGASPLLLGFVFLCCVVFSWV